MQPPKGKRIGMTWRTDRAASRFARPGRSGGSNAGRRRGRMLASLPLVVALSGFGGRHLALAEPAAPSTPKSPDTVQVTAEQLHQLSIVPVETYAFRLQKTAVGQIAFNEDASTVVLTPFSGRVTRLIAKLGDNVERGDPLFEID